MEKSLLSDQEGEVSEEFRERLVGLIEIAIEDHKFTSHYSLAELIFDYLEHDQRKRKESHVN